MLPRPRNYTQLQPEDHVTLASLQQQSYSILAMARLLNRPASTISHELRRNAVAGSYASGAAQQACGHRRRRGRPLRKLHVDSILFGAVEHFMRLHWSPEQIALALARLYPRGHNYRVLLRSAQPVAEASNENMNGLVRQYLPKGTDLSGYTQEQLDAIADEINDRPRKGLGVRSALAIYRELLLNSSHSSTLIP